MNSDNATGNPVSEQKSAAAFTLRDKNANPVALKSIEITSRVTDSFAETKIVQIYRNDETVPIETLYCFPAEYEATITGLRIVSEECTLEARAENKEQAQKKYDNAVAARNFAALLIEEGKDLLTMQVGNIKPGAEARVEITTVSQLSAFDGVLRLQIPSTVSPRYISSGTDPVVADIVNGPRTENAPYGFRMYVEVMKTGKVTLSCVSHKVTPKEEEGCWVVEIIGQASDFDRDFILEIRRGDEEQAQCLIAEHANGHKALMIRLFPKLPALPGPERAPRTVIFVVDCSGSMSGSSIVDAREALRQCVRAMRPGDYANIICFGSRAASYAPEAVVIDHENLFRLLAYIDRIDANMGGTKLLSAMQEAIRMQQSAGKEKEIFLITDGEVSNPEAVIGEVKKAGGLRIFSFGIGYGASHALVKGVAEATGGAAEMIQPGESVSEKVLRQFGRFEQPHVENVTVALENITAEPPAFIPPFYDGDSFTVLLPVEEVKENPRVTISGKLNGEEFFIGDFSPAVIQNNAIPALWCKQEIKEKMPADPDLIRGGDLRKNKSVKRLTKLAIDFNILTELTSFVAVHVRDEADKTTGDAAFRKIVLQLTRDWHDTASRRIVSCSVRPSASDEAVHAKRYEMSRRSSDDSATAESDCLPFYPEARGIMLKTVSRNEHEELQTKHKELQEKLEEQSALNEVLFRMNSALEKRTKELEAQFEQLKQETDGLQAKIHGLKSIFERLMQMIEKTLESLHNLSRFGEAVPRLFDEFQKLRDIFREYSREDGPRR